MKNLLMAAAIGDIAGSAYEGRATSDERLRQCEDVFVQSPFYG